FDSDAYYVFIMRGSGASSSGFMPFKRQFGFIFSDNLNGAPIAKVIAHELGHGAFRLRHNFEEFAVTQGSTSNLMDYSSGVKLKKYQWDNVHHPESMSSWLQDDESSAFEPYEYLSGRNVISGVFKQVVGINSDRISFVTNAGKIITLPGDAKDVTFHNSGTLLGFTIGSVRYISAQYVRGEFAGSFAGFLNEFTSQDYSEKVYKDTYSKEIKLAGATTTDVYFGIINRNSDNEAGCGIDVFEGTYPLSDINTSHNYNTGGNKQPRVQAIDIQNKLTSTFEGEQSSLYGNKIRYLKTESSTHACDVCPKGTEFFETYSELTDSDSDLNYLAQVVDFICQQETTDANLEIIQAQIESDFNNQMQNVFWLSDRALYRKARDAYWERPDAWEFYLKALERTKDNISRFNEQLQANASKEDYYAALYYLNDAFLAQLSTDEKIVLLKTIFEHNLWISYNLFDPERSDVAMIKKVISSIAGGTELNEFINKIIEEKESFSDTNRYVLFEVSEALTETEMASLSIETKLSMLQMLLNGSLNRFFNNHHAVIAKVVKSVRDEDASTFFSEIESSENYSIENKPLLYHLKEKLSDFLTGNSYSAFFMEIKRLSDAKNRMANGNLDIKTFVNWDVKNVDYVIISLVRNKNDFNFQYDDNTHTVSMNTCKRYDWTQPTSPQVPSTRYCAEYENLLPVGSSPFDLVGVTIINDVSPFARGCVDGQGPGEICGEMIYLPAIFLDYLDVNVDKQRWKNFGWNTFNVIITISTFGEGAAAITAIRTAQAGTRLATTVRHAWSLADFTFTVGTMTAKTFNVQLPKELEYVGWLFAAKTSFDLVQKGGAKGLAYLKKASRQERKRILDELDIKKNGRSPNEDEATEIVDDLVAKADDNPEFKRQYEEALNAPSNISIKDGILSKLDDIDPNGFTEFRTWLNQFDDSPAMLSKLDDLGDDVVELAGDFRSLPSNFDFGLLSAWDVLKKFPQIRVQPGNIEV
ncbi:MAG: hypothetical protein WBA74_27420, partial [Cyclobacteriaceae bacterium]